MLKKQWYLRGEQPEGITGDVLTTDIYKREVQTDGSIRFNFDIKGTSLNISNYPQFPPALSMWGGVKNFNIKRFHPRLEATFSCHFTPFLSTSRHFPLFPAISCCFLSFSAVSCNFSHCLQPCTVFPSIPATFHHLPLFPATFCHFPYHNKLENLKRCEITKMGGFNQYNCLVNTTPLHYISSHLFLNVTTVVITIREG